MMMIMSYELIAGDSFRSCLEFWGIVHQRLSDTLLAIGVGTLLSGDLFRYDDRKYMYI